MSRPPWEALFAGTCASAGSRLVWVVDPEAKTVAVYRTLLAPRFLGIEDSLDGEDVVPGFTLPVAEIFEP